MALDVWRCKVGFMQRGAFMLVSRGGIVLVGGVVLAGGGCQNHT